MIKRKPYWMISIENCWYVYSLRKFVPTDKLTDDMRKHMTTMVSIQYYKTVKRIIRRFILENPNKHPNIERRKEYYKVYSISV